MRRAFTLVELLAVIAIIAMLIALLLPALSSAKQQAQSVSCLSNLRQLALAAQMYTDAHNGAFPPAYWYGTENGVPVTYNWDFTTRLVGGVHQIEPGLLWMGQQSPAIQQCPSFDGRSATPADPFTGYNYNTSFVGRGQFEAVPHPARRGQIRNPTRLALFGDGQWAGGANKFMRSPLPGPFDASFGQRATGTQGFRHRGRTNVAFADGHAASIGTRHTTTTPSQSGAIAPGTGFLSEDNAMYALE